MKITILQQDLLPALQSVSRSAGSKNLPVLANILFRTRDGKLELSATNLEVGIVKTVSVTIIEDGEITVPARTLVDIVSSLSSETIEIESAAEQLKISTKNFSGTLNGISANEFPEIPLSSEQTVSISSKVLQQALPQITFAAAADEGRPILTGILTEIKKDKLEMVATDGFRLAHKTTTLEKEFETPFRTLIPRKTFEEVMRLMAEDLKEEDGVVEIGTSESQNQMIFKIGQTQLSSRLIEGQFPNWEKIVPSQFENKTTLDKHEALKSVKLASVFSRSEANIVSLKIKEGKLKITSQAKELGGQETEVDVSSEGTDIEISFNSRFLIDALSACPGEKIVMQFAGNMSAVVLKPTEDSGLEYVIMPIRLG